ncbi:MAG: DNA-binding protein [Candidatus Omnitrophica bacterium]|nr:DNA-binding protein [Candidatus Omnitrophota bacterium]
MSHVTCHTSHVILRNAIRSIQGAILLGVVFLALGKSFAQTISSTELINKAKDYDGQTVVFQGEVIGEVMARGEYAWVNLNDGKNALGIWIKKDLVGKIANTGSYKVIGDLVEVSGAFHRSCLVHGGDLDIHAESLQVLKSGNRVKQHLSSHRQKLAFGLGTILIILWISTVLIKPRKRK